MLFVLHSYISRNRGSRRGGEYITHHQLTLRVKRHFLFRPSPLSFTHQHYITSKFYFALLTIWWTNWFTSPSLEGFFFPQIFQNRTHCNSFATFKLASRAQLPPPIDCLRVDVLRRVSKRREDPTVPFIPHIPSPHFPPSASHFTLFLSVHPSNSSFGERFLRKQRCF